jgi:hypothetical protein
MLTISPSDIEKMLDETFPHGADGFARLALEEAELHSAKNFDYAGGSDDALGNFHRAGKLLSLYPLLQHPGKEEVKWCMLMMLKQFDAVLAMLSNDYEGQVEGLEPRLKDISVYAKIAILLNREYNKEPKSTKENEQPHDH